MKDFIRILTSIVCAAFLSACQTGENSAPVKPVPEPAEYTVTFAFDYDAAGGPPPAITVKAGSTPGGSFPNDPARDGWEFSGWYNYADVYTRDTPITKNTQLTARWRLEITGNPAIDQRFGVFTADPAALVVGDTVYLYTGHDENPGSSTGSFKMFDWLCFSTRDMKKWTYHGPVLARRDFSWGRPIPAPGGKEAEFAVADAWAAQVVQRGSKFYFYVTTRSSLDAGDPRAIGVAVGSSPVGPFKATGEPVIRGTEMPDDIDDWGKHIDPTVWVDDDGTPYLAWGNTTGAVKPNGFAYEHCYMAKLAPNMIQMSGDIWTQHLDNYTEGPWLYKRGQWYYLVYASHTMKTPTNANTGSERISYAMAESITGPWTSKGQLTGPARGFTIHPSIIEFKGQSYFIYHTDAPFTLNDFYGQPVSGAIGRRAVCIEYLYYNDDGTIKPIIQTTAGISVPPRQ